MAQTTYTFSGPVRWAKVHTTDQKFGKHGIEIQLDEEGLEKYKESGLQGRSSKDGEGYYSFRRDPKQLVWVDGTRQAAGKPHVFDADGYAITDLIGNGSVCTISVTVYDYDNSFGKGKGHRLEAVRVDELVKYEKQDTASSAPSLSDRIGVKF